MKGLFRGLLKEISRLLKEGIKEISLMCKEIYSDIVSTKEYYLREIIHYHPIFRKFSPNAWCYLRGVLGIPVAMLYNRGYILYSILLYLFGLWTDLMDGVHARATDQISDKGAKLDANMDKIFMAEILLIADSDAINGLIVIVLLSIEAVLFMTANWLKPLLNRKPYYCFKVGSNSFGKIKMTIQGFAVVFLLLEPYYPTIALFGEILLWVSILFAIGSFLRHLHLKDKKLEKSKTKNLSQVEKIEWLAKQKEMRIVTIPNIITFSRLVLVFPASFALINHNWYLATPLWTWIFNSDWLDGYLARKLKQVTLLGARLEPISDNLVKFSISICFFYMYFDVLAIRQMMLAVLTVEIFIVIINLYTIYKYKEKNLVNIWGKRRIAVHFSVLTAIYFYASGVIDWLTNYLVIESISSIDYFIPCLIVMLLSSFVALIFYIKQFKTIISTKRY